jgi:hypothetical protein
VSDDPFEASSRVDRWILVFVREPTLWPVLLVVIGHAVVLVGPLFLWSFRDGRSGPALALVLLAALSAAAIVWELRRRGPGALTALLLSTWTLSAAAALAAHRYELL